MPSALKRDNSLQPAYTELLQPFSQNEILLITLYFSNLEALFFQQHRASAEVQNKASGVNNHASTVIPAPGKMCVTDQKIACLWSKGLE